MYLLDDGAAISVGIGEDACRLDSFFFLLLPMMIAEYCLMRWIQTDDAQAVCLCDWGAKCVVRASIGGHVTLMTLSPVYRLKSVSPIAVDDSTVISYRTIR